MMKLKTMAIALTFIGIGAAGVIVAAPQVRSGRPTPPAARGQRADRQKTQQAARAADAGSGKVQPALHSLENYVIEPPDMIIVEVLEALPGRPISGERLVRPDGKISLGFYGEVYVAGLTIPEAKEKIVLHLRKYLADHVLGLTDRGDVQNVEGEIAPSKLRNTDRVFVDVTTYNSKNYHVQGAVKSPGKIPVTGHDTVLDAIEYAEGLSPRADHDHVVLYRQEKNGTLQRLPINVDQIMMGDDPTTNYQLLPGDRLVVPFKPGAAAEAEEVEEPRPVTSSGRSDATRSPGRSERRPLATRPEADEDRGPAPRQDVDRDATSRALIRMERRLNEVERKLDRVLEALEKRER